MAAAMRDDAAAIQSLLSLGADASKRVELRQGPSLSGLDRLTGYVLLFQTFQGKKKPAKETKQNNTKQRKQADQNKPKKQTNKKHTHTHTQT